MTQNVTVIYTLVDKISKQAGKISSTLGKLEDNMADIDKATKDLSKLTGKDLNDSYKRINKQIDENIKRIKQEIKIHDQLNKEHVRLARNLKNTTSAERNAATAHAAAGRNLNFMRNALNGASNSLTSLRDGLQRAARDTNVLSRGFNAFSRDVSTFRRSVGTALNDLGLLERGARRAASARKELSNAFGSVMNYSFFREGIKSGLEFFQVHVKILGILPVVGVAIGGITQMIGSLSIALAGAVGSLGRFLGGLGGLATGLYTALGAGMIGFKGIFSNIIKPSMEGAKKLKGVTKQISKARKDLADEKAKLKATVEDPTAFGEAHRARFGMSVGLNKNASDPLQQLLDQQERLNDLTSQYGAEVDKMPAAWQEISKAVENLKNQWKNLWQNNQKFTDAVLTSIKAISGALASDEITKVFEAYGNLALKVSTILKDELGSAKTREKLRDVWVGAIANVGKMADLLQKLLPYMTAFIGEINRFTGRTLDTFISKVNGSEGAVENFRASLERFFVRAGESLNTWYTAFMNFFNGFRVLNDAGGFIEKFEAGLISVSEAFLGWSKNVKKSDATAVVENSFKILGGLKEVVIGIKDAFATVLLDPAAVKETVKFLKNLAGGFRLLGRFMATSLKKTGPSLNRFFDVLGRWFGNQKNMDAMARSTARFIDILTKWFDFLDKSIPPELLEFFLSMRMALFGIGLIIGNLLTPFARLAGLVLGLSSAITSLGTAFVTLNAGWKGFQGLLDGGISKAVKAIKEQSIAGKAVSSLTFGKKTGPRGANLGPGEFPFAPPEMKSQAKATHEAATRYGFGVPYNPAHTGAVEGIIGARGVQPTKKGGSRRPEDAMKAFTELSNPLKGATKQGYLFNEPIQHTSELLSQQANFLVGIEELQQNHLRILDYIDGKVEAISNSTSKLKSIQDEISYIEKDRLDIQKKLASMAGQSGTTKNLEVYKGLLEDGVALDKKKESLARSFNTELLKRRALYYQLADLEEARAGIASKLDKIKTPSRATRIKEGIGRAYKSRAMAPARGFGKLAAEGTFVPVILREFGVTGKQVITALGDTGNKIIRSLGRGLKGTGRAIGGAAGKAGGAVGGATIKAMYALEGAMYIAQLAFINLKLELTLLAGVLQGVMKLKLAKGLEVVAKAIQPVARVFRSLMDQAILLKIAYDNWIIGVIEGAVIEPVAEKISKLSKAIEQLKDFMISLKNEIRFFVMKIKIGFTLTLEDSVVKLTGAFEKLRETLTLSIGAVGKGLKGLGLAAGAAGAFILTKGKAGGLSALSGAGRAARATAAGAKSAAGGAKAAATGAATKAAGVAGGLKSVLSGGLSGIGPRAGAAAKGVSLGGVARGALRVAGGAVNVVGLGLPKVAAKATAGAPGALKSGVMGVRTAPKGSIVGKGFMGKLGAPARLIEQFGAGARSAGTFGKAIFGLSKIFGFFVSPVQLVISMISALMTDFGGIRTSISKLAEVLKGQLGKAFDNLANSLGMKGGGGGMFKTLLHYLDVITNVIGVGLLETIKAVATWFIGLFSGIINQIALFITYFKKIGTLIGQLRTGKISLGEFIKGVGGAMVDLVKGTFNNVLNTVKDIFVNIISNFSLGFYKAMKAVVDAVEKIAPVGNLSEKLGLDGKIKALEDEKKLREQAAAAEQEHAKAVDAALKKYKTQEALTAKIASNNSEISRLQASISTDPNALNRISQLTSENTVLGEAKGQAPKAVTNQESAGMTVQKASELPGVTAGPRGATVKWDMKSVETFVGQMGVIEAETKKLIKAITKLVDHMGNYPAKKAVEIIGIWTYIGDQISKALQEALSTMEKDLNNALTSVGASKIEFSKGKDQTSDVLQLASGGRVPMVNGADPNKDSVPAMLTPGEVVLNQRQQQKVGHDNIARALSHSPMANTDTARRPQYFAKGGVVGGGPVAYWPTNPHGTVAGGPGQGTHSFSSPPNNWQSDNAVDIAVPEGSTAVAIVNGNITRTGGNNNDPSSRYNGFNAYLSGGGNEWFYTHLSKLLVSAGQKVNAGDAIGLTGSANGVPHLHIGQKLGNPADTFGAEIGGAAAGIVEGVAAALSLSDPGIIGGGGLGAVATAGAQIVKAAINKVFGPSDDMDVNATFSSGPLADMIRWAAGQYKASPEGLLRVAKAESSMNPNAVNDWDTNALNGTPSKGLFQFIESTFNDYSKQAMNANSAAWMGVSREWLNPKAQALTAAWAFTHGKGSAWSTYDQYGGNFGDGGHFIAKKPMMIGVGDKQPEEVRVTPTSGPNKGKHSGGSTTVINSTINLGTLIADEGGVEKLTEEIGKQIRHDIRAARKAKPHKD